MRKNTKDVTDKYLNYGNVAKDVYYIKTRYMQVGDNEHEWLDVITTEILDGTWVREHMEEIAKGGLEACAVLQEGCDYYLGLKDEYPNVKMTWFLFDKYIDENSVIYSVNKK